MYGTKSKIDLAFEYQSQVAVLRPSIHSRRANLTVKFQDLYGFTVEGNVDDVNVLNEVREKVRQQGRVWWALEASKGANWYLHTTIGQSSALTSSLKFSALTNAITLKKLIRKGIPPVLRPKIWFSLSGAAKKKSTVPDSYYDDLTKAVDGKVTPATRQIDHVRSSPFSFLWSSHTLEFGFEFECKFLCYGSGHHGSSVLFGCLLFTSVCRFVDHFQMNLMDFALCLLTKISDRILLQIFMNDCLRCFCVFPPMSKILYLWIWYWELRKICKNWSICQSYVCNLYNYRILEPYCISHLNNLHKIWLRQNVALSKSWSEKDGNLCDPWYS